MKESHKIHYFLQYHLLRLFVMLISLITFYHYHIQPWKIRLSINDQNYLHSNELSSSREYLKHRWSYCTLNTLCPLLSVLLSVFEILLFLHWFSEESNNDHNLWFTNKKKIFEIVKIIFFCIHWILFWKFQH